MSLTFCMTGDVFLGSQASNKLLLEADFEQLWTAADFRIVNFEAPVVTSDVTPIKKAGLVLSQSSSAASALIDLGVDFFDLANNHMGDFGIEGIIQTIGAIGEQRILGVSIPSDKEPADPYYFRTVEKNGIKVALFAFAEAETGVDTRPGQHSPIAWVCHHCVQDRIREARLTHDFVVVLVHAGIEDVQIPLPEWRAVYRQLVDWGVSAVIAHHPHVPQGFEYYKNSVIAYSLGNFYMNLQSTSPHWNSGLVGFLTLDKGRNPVWEPILIDSADGRVAIRATEKSSEYLVELNHQLESAVYQKAWNLIEEDLWSSRYQYYARGYSLSFSSNSSFKERLKVALKGLLKRGLRERPEILFHNIHIDSHRWFFERILEKKGLS